MSNELDPLEQELRSLKPLAPSPQVRGEIDRQLRRPIRWRIVGGIAAAAAVLSLVAWVVWRDQPDPTMPVPRLVETQHDSPLTYPSRGPDVTAWRYHLVARESPDQLMRLLDQQAAQAPALGGPTPNLNLDELLESQS